MKNSSVAIVLAAGRGKRMNSSIQKQYMLLRGKPLLYYSLKTFQESFIDEMVLVVSEGEEEYCSREIVEKYGFTKVKKLVCGGAERYHSVLNGLRAITTEPAYVYIHDGARPFVTQKILETARECVEKNRACVVGMPSKDTVKIADSRGFIESTPQRQLVWNVQTPQVFEYRLALLSYERLAAVEENLRAEGIGITDDAQVVEYFSDTKVALCPGSYRNIKITTPEDMTVAEAFLQP